MKLTSDVQPMGKVFDPIYTINKDPNANIQITTLDLTSAEVQSQMEYLVIRVDGVQKAIIRIAS